MADTFPLKLLLLTVSGWVNRHQQDTIAYFVEENRVLKEKLGGRCPRLDDDQRRRLAAKAKRLGRKTLNQIAAIVTPDTLMRWYSRLIAAKWTYPTKRRVGRPGLMKAIAALIVRLATENSWLGLLPHPRRTQECRAYSRLDHDRQRSESEWHQARSGPTFVVDGIPQGPLGSDRCDGLLHH